MAASIASGRGGKTILFAGHEPGGRAGRGRDLLHWVIAILRIALTMLVAFYFC